MTIARLWDGLAALVYPRRAVCMGCRSQAGFAQDWLCDDCRRLMAKLWLGAQPAPEVPGIAGAAFAYRYNGPVKGMVRQLKYRGTYRLADAMAADMARAYRSLLPTGATMIVAVPMHPRRQRRRGFNHAGLLAEKTAALTGLDCSNALSRTRYTTQQARLSREARLGNMRGAFACDESVRGRRVVLVDDVCTTGATASACVEALRQAGAAAVYLLCYARAEPPGQEKK